MVRIVGFVWGQIFFAGLKLGEGGLSRTEVAIKRGLLLTGSSQTENRIVSEDQPEELGLISDKEIP